MGAWIGLIWLSMWTWGGVLLIRQWTFGFHKMWGICWSGEELLASQVGFCCMELVYWSYIKYILYLTDAYWFFLFIFRNGMSHVKLTKIYTGTFSGRWARTSATKLEALHSFQTLALG